MFNKISIFFRLIKNPINFIKFLMAKHTEHCQFNDQKKNLNFSYAEKMAATKYYNKVKLLAPPNIAPKVIDVACGPGRYIAVLSTLGYQVTGVDMGQFQEWLYLRKTTNAELKSSVNAEHLEFQDNSFDQALCIGALFYFDNPHKAILELKRVVKPGGKIILSTVNSNSHHACAQKLKNRDDSLERLNQYIQKSGFQLEESFTYGYTPPIFKRLWSYLYYCWIPIRFYDFLSSLTPEKNRPVITFILKNTK